MVARKCDRHIRHRDHPVRDDDPSDHLPGNRYRWLWRDLSQRRHELWQRQWASYRSTKSRAPARTAHSSRPKASTGRTVSPLDRVHRSRHSHCSPLRPESPRVQRSGFARSFESSSGIEPEGRSGLGVSRDPDGGSPILSSAAPGRLHSASSVTSNNVGVVARRCVMVLTPATQKFAGQSRSDGPALLVSGHLCSRLGHRSVTSSST